MDNNHFGKNIDIRNIHLPLLIVNSDGNIIDKNEMVNEILGLKEISDDFLLLNNKLGNVAVSYIRTVIRDKEYNKISFLPSFFNNKHFKNFNNIYLVSNYLGNDMCLIEIKKISEYNKLGLECIRLINYEESLNKSAFILSKQDINSPVKALQNILKTFNASRICINKNFRDKNGDFSMQCEEEVCALGISSIKNNPELKTIRYSDGYIRWVLELSAGRILSGYLKNFPHNESHYLASMNIIYLLIIPIFVDDKWLGFVELDFCYNNIKISALDIQTLRRLSEQFAGYYSILQYNQKIYDVNDQFFKNIEFKNKMASLMRHDIKNPLSGIMGFSELLNSEIENFSKERIIEYSQLINKSADSLSKVVDDISSWVKTAQSDINYDVNSDIKSVFIKEIVEKSFSLVKIMASHKSINLLNEIEDDCSIDTDFNMMYTVLRNIIINAIKFTPEKGTIIVSSKNDVKIKNNIIISIADTGMGMSKKRITQILEESKVVSEKGTNGESGLGLGLQFSKRFIHILKGEMRIESSKGKGTIFLVSLPKGK